MKLPIGLIILPIILSLSPSCNAMEYVTSAPNEPNHLELKAFTKYYVLGVDFQKPFLGCARKCMSRHFESQSDLDDCMRRKCTSVNSGLSFVNITEGNPSRFREDTRDCPNAPVDCKLVAEGTGSLYACPEVNSKMGYKRYTRIQPNDTCMNGREAFDISAEYGIAFPLRCVCPEESYYISTRRIQANNGHVIVGAQIQISSDNVLYLKVKQGKPMERGIIDGAEWLDATPNKSETEKISWGDCDEFDLSEIKLLNDRVIVGLAFTGCINGRIHLRVSSKTFNLDTGTVSDDLRDEELVTGTKLYNVNNANVPTSGINQNRPIDPTKDGDYVKLSLSSLELDGGQTTVPFIDTQEVVPAKLVALSGASLVLRTQPGYGGFLSLRFSTYVSTYAAS